MSNKSLKYTDNIVIFDYVLQCTIMYCIFYRIVYYTLYLIETSDTSHAIVQQLNTFVYTNIIVLSNPAKLYNNDEIKKANNSLSCVLSFLDFKCLVVRNRIVNVTKQQRKTEMAVK